MGFLNFDARVVQPQAALEPLPPGWYKVVIRKSNMKQTAKGDGGYLELPCEVIEGPFTGRLIFWNLNLFNPSQQAVEIAQKQLSAICHVVGQFNVPGHATPDGAAIELHNIPFNILVVITQGEKGPMNNVKGCKDVYGNDPGKQQGAIPGQPQGQPASAPGWQQPQQGGIAPGGFVPQTAPQQAAPGGFVPQPQPLPATPAWPGAAPGTQQPSPQGWVAPVTLPQPGPAAPAAQPQPQQWQQPQPQAQPQGGAPTWTPTGPTQQAAPAAPQQQWTQQAAPGAPPAWAR